MPATLVAPHASASAAVIETLSGMERAVALYSSDMPNGYRYQRSSGPALIAWILQGTVRLGREETRRRASYLAGHRKLWLRDMTTQEIDRRHAERFPSARRLNRAEELASASVMWLVGVAPEARHLPAVIDGCCPECDNFGKIWGTWVIDAGSDWSEEGYRACWACQTGGGAA
jgi:hypothetical protein